MYLCTCYLFDFALNEEELTLKRERNVTALFLVCLVILSIIPTNKVNAASFEDVNIISETNVSLRDAEKWAKSKGASEDFVDIAEIYFDNAEDHGGVNPAIAYVQAAKETSYGNFGGVLDESYHNPCGMKTIVGGDDYDINAHEAFDSWEDGVNAHLDHLALYAGVEGYPRNDTEDPRHFITIKGRASTVNALGGNWAPSVTYGEEVNELYADLLDYADEELSESEIVEESSKSETSNNNEDDESNINENSNNDEDNIDEDNIDEDSSDNENSKSEDESFDDNDNNLDKNDELFEMIIPKGVEATEPIAEPQNEENNISSKIGWKKQSGEWYYYKDDNSKATGWIKPDGNWYYLNSDGSMATGWNYLYGKWYYLKPWGGMQLGWLKDGSKWYYLEGNGAMSTGMKLINGKKYFMDVSGAMRTNWFKISDNWYYFSQSGDMSTGWILSGGKWYYMNENGTMATGWIKIEDKWYYLSESGIMENGWIEYNSEEYYLMGSGELARNTVIDGFNVGYDGSKQDNSISDDSTNDDEVNDSNGDDEVNDSNSDDEDEITNEDDENDKSSDEDENETTNDDDKAKNDDDDEINDDKVGASVFKGKKIVVVDAGHNYGGDEGAYATHNGILYSERDLNMRLAMKVKKELEENNYVVIMTRDENERATLPVTESLTNRVNKANSFGADLFISIHHNIASSVTANGVEVYYSSKPQDDKFGSYYSSSKISESRSLASSVVNSISSETGAYNRGAKDANFFVCRNTEMPAILIEVGFLSNEEEAENCASDSYQKKVAEAIVDSVEKASF